MDELRLTMSWVDYGVFIFSLILSAGLGLYYSCQGGGQKTNRQYLLGNQQLSIWPVAMSLMASFMSAITLLGVPAEIYKFGTMFIYINLSYIIATPICAFVFLPVFYNLQVTSAYEYLELRFNRPVRTVASLTFLVQMIVYMGIVLYAPALALSAVTGIDKWWSIISVGLVCTIYCSFGGIKAVVWTDFLQSILMFFALVVVAIMGYNSIGGWDPFIARTTHGNRIQLSDFSFDPTVRHSFWSLTFGGIFIYCSLYGVNQTQVQRLMTVRTLKEAQLALFLSWPITSILSITCIITGLVMYAYFANCDPLTQKTVAQADQLLPLFMMQVMGKIPGLPGLFVAGIFSGALSSVSSFVNSLAAVVLEDYFKPIVLATGRPPLKEETETIVTKGFALMFGFICLLLTYVAEQMTGILEASLTIFGVVGGPLLGLFTLGMTSRTCSSRSALIAFIVSLSLGFWIGFGSVANGPKPVKLHMSTSGCANSTGIPFHRKPILDDNIFYLYRLSYMWTAAITFTVEYLIGIALSWSLFPNEGIVNPRLLAPYMTKEIKNRPHLRGSISISNDPPLPMGILTVDGSSLQREKLQLDSNSGHN